MKLDQAQDRIVEQIIRPTGLLDPVIEVRPATSQVDDLLEEIRMRSGARRGGAGDHPDQAHGRGPDRVLSRMSGSRSAICIRTSTPWSGWS